MLELLLTLKDGTVHRFPLKSLPLVAGRAGRSTLRIPHKSISREHARFFDRDGALHVADLNSSNGSFVNGKKISLAEVKAGDEVRLGVLAFKVTEAGAEPTPPSVPRESKKPVPEPRPEPAHQDEDDSLEVEEFILPDSEEEEADTRSAPLPEKPAPKAAPRAGAQPRTPSPAQPRSYATGQPHAPAPARPGSAGDSGDGPIRVKQDLLQFHRKDAQKGRSFLKDDFSQIGGTWKLLIVAALLALCIGVFYLSYTVMFKVTPDGLGSGSNAPMEDAVPSEDDPDWNE